MMPSGNAAANADRRCANSSLVMRGGGAGLVVSARGCPSAVEGAAKMARTASDVAAKRIIGNDGKVNCLPRTARTSADCSQPGAGVVLVRTSAILLLKQKITDRP